MTLAYLRKKLNQVSFAPLPLKVTLPVLRLIYVHRRVIPSKLLAGFDALVLLAELEIVVHFEVFDVTLQLVNGDRRVGDHAGRLEVQSEKGKTFY